MPAEIIVNGEKTPLAAKTIAELIDARGVRDSRGVAVALNGTVVPRTSWPDTKLGAGDEIEIIKVMVGG